MFTKLIGGLVLALTLAGGLGAVPHTMAASQDTGAATSDPGLCPSHYAAFTVQITQPIAIFMPKQQVVRGTCFPRGAYINVQDDSALVSITGGWHFVSSNAQWQIGYTIPSAPCAHALVVRVWDIATNHQVSGYPYKIYGLCPPPPPVLTQ